jgi:hypothetical protein
MFNLDEFGSSDWSDDTSCGISKCEKRFRDCLPVAAGESLLYYMVTSPSSLTLQKHLTTHGVHFGRDFTLKFNQKH